MGTSILHTLHWKLGTTIAFIGILCGFAAVGCGPNEEAAALLRQNQAATATVVQQSSGTTASTEEGTLDGASDQAIARASGFVPPIELAIAGEGAELEVDSARATSHPHGDQICASGCAASRHPTPPLSESHFRELLADFAQQPADGQSESLDKLVFYGPQSRRYLARESAQLSHDHLGRLNQELAVDDLIVQLRVIDEQDVVRVGLPPTRVPQHVRQEFAMVVENFQPTVTSGTVKRVSVLHAWQRL